MAVRGNNSLYFASGIDNSGLLQGKAQAVNIISDLASSVARINPFAALAVGAVAAFGKISAEAYNMAKVYEAAMKEVQTISKATQDDFKGVSSAIIDISKNTTDGPEKLAKAFYQIVSAGYDGAKGLKLLEVASKAAVAGVTDTETAADGITTVLNAFKLEAEEAEAVSDALFKTVELGKTTFSELSQNLAQAAPLAAATGVDFRELLAAVASLTKQGVPTAQAMTQIRAGIEATSEVLGDGWANAYTLQEAFQAVSDKAGGSQNKLKELTGRVEAVSAILSTTGDNAKGAAQDLDALSNSAGAAGRAFNTQMTGNINQWNILTNRIKAATHDLGNNLLEVSSGIAEYLNEITEGTDRVIVSLEKERKELLLTQDTLIDVNTTQEDRIKLIEDLRKRYPGYFADLKTEEISNNDVRDAIKGINDELLNRIVLQEDVNAVEKAQSEADNKKIDKSLAEKKLRLELVESAKKYGIELSENNDLIGRAQELMKALPDDEDVNGFGAVPRLRALIGQLQGAQRRAEEANKILDKMEQRKREVEIALNINTDDGKDVEQTIEEQLKAIKNAETRDELAKYLKSENDVIRKAAEERLKILRSLLNPDLDPDKILRPKDLKTVSELGLTNTGLDTNLLFNISYQIDPTSIRFIQNHIRVLREQFETANELNRPNIKVWLDYWEKRLKEVTDGTKEETELYNNLTLSLADLSLRQLFEYKKYWQERLKQAKKGSDQEKEAIQNIDAASQQIGTTISSSFNDISNALNSAESLFRKFGNETLADTLNQLSQVAQGVGTIAQGVASQNPFQTAAGIIQTLDALITTGIDSDTAKFEKAIKELERVIDKLDYTISKSIGDERIGSRIKAIEELEELEKQANAAAEAEAKARKEIKYLGITIAKKGKGSGTDQGKLEDLEEKAEDAKQRVQELREQLDELYTGTTQGTIVDSIIAGLKEGKKEIADFADTFQGLMEDALLQAFQTRYLEKEIAKFYDAFSDAGSDSNYTPDEIASLRTLYNTIISGAQNDINTINEILEGLNLDPLGGDGQQKQGLSGAISTITEDTANILAGTTNAIRLDVRNGVEIAQASAEYLAIISQGITTYLPFLQSIDGRMANIESGLLQIQSQG